MFLAIKNPEILAVVVRRHLSIPSRPSRHKTQTLDSVMTFPGHGRFCDVIFNLDEMGVPEWEDGESESVIIPMDLKGRLIRHEARRAINHLTMLACVAANGDALRVVIVSSLKILDDIYHSGRRVGSNFVVGRNGKFYVDTPLFEGFIRHRFILYITSRSTIPCDPRVEAFHFTSPGDVFWLFGENHVKIVVFAPHKTNVFQALDLSFFGIFQTKEKFWIGQYHDSNLAATIHALVR
jgi:hypothetical protein